MQPIALPIILDVAQFQLTDHQRRELEVLCRRFNVMRLEIFGSATAEAYQPERSDLDFLVEFAPGTDLGPWMSAYFDLRESLAALLQRPVDLIFGTALKNPYFARSVNETRRIVYESQIPEAT